MYMSAYREGCITGEVACMASRKEPQISHLNTHSRDLDRGPVRMKSIKTTPWISASFFFFFFCTDPSCSDRSFCCVCNSETCGSTVCAWGARCVQNKCECPQCTGEPLSTVCGSDGTTYNNECELRTSSCMQKRRIDVARLGSCDEGRKWTLKWCNYANQSAIEMV